MLEIVLVGVLVFVITKTKRGLSFRNYENYKTPKFTVKFDLKLGGKDRT